MSPEEALKIAASQWTEIPTAEKILAALSAAGFMISQIDSQAKLSLRGDEIAALRIERGLSQMQVASAVGTSQQTIARIENGENEYSRFTHIVSSYLQGAAGVERDDDPIRVVQNILDRRKITATELARNAGVAQSTVNRQMKKKDYMISTRTLKKIKDWDEAQP